MGNSCSSGQAHKDKDNMSQRSEESTSYQVTIKKPSLQTEKQQAIINNVLQQGGVDGGKAPHSGVIMDAATAGQPPVATTALTTPADKKTGVNIIRKEDAIISGQMEVAYIIPVLFLNNSLGTPLLPITIESADFKMAMEAAKNQSAHSLLSKWYQLDSAAAPPCYRLQPISSHIPGFKETSAEERERALEEWRSEIGRVLAILVSVLPTELRDTYLTTVVEQEVHNTVFMSQELAKRCVWINRVYTPAVRTPDQMEPGEAELHRRLNNLQRDLKNQLNEKHIIRLPVKYVEGGLNTSVPEHAQYVAQVCSLLRRQLQDTVDAIADEHQSKVLLRPSQGVPAALFEELNQQTNFCQRAAQCSVNREQVLGEIKKYITSELTSPLVIYGPGGCGKTTLIARMAQCCQQWLPEAFLILRFVAISTQSDTIEQLLNSVSNQCSILTYGHQCYCTHNLETYSKILPSVLSASCLQRPLVILIDGIDQFKSYSTKITDWVPNILPGNIKLILTVTEDDAMHQDLTGRLDEASFIKMPLLGESGGCVISGLEDARILVWDLITGNCRWSLHGHTAPVSLLRLDPTGGFCLSTDKESSANVSACEISCGGRFLLLALEGHSNLVTLRLRGPGAAVPPQEREPYGDVENDGKEFDMKDVEAPC